MIRSILLKSRLFIPPYGGTRQDAMHTTHAITIVTHETPLFHLRSVGIFITSAAYPGRF